MKHTTWEDIKWLCIVAAALIIVGVPYVLDRTILQMRRARKAKTLSKIIQRNMEREGVWLARMLMAAMDYDALCRFDDLFKKFKLEYHYVDGYDAIRSDLAEGRKQRQKDIRHREIIRSFDFTYPQKEGE